MIYSVELSKSSVKTFKKLEIKWKKKISTALLHIAKNPQRGIKLKGEFEGLYKYDVWPFRIIYEVKKKKLIVSIISIGQREGVYKRLK